MKVRQIMCVVAVVALLLGGGFEGRRLWSRSRAYQRRAAVASELAGHFRRAADEGRDFTLDCTYESRPPRPSPRRLAEMRREAARYAEKARAYSRAAACPWISVGVIRSLEPRNPSP